MTFYRLLRLLTFAFTLATFSCATFAQEIPTVKPTAPKVHSQYAVLMDAMTGKILWGHGEYVHRSMASTTKMMTALLLLEHGHLSDIVTAPPGVQYLPESSLHLSPGEQLTLHDLLYAMLLRSANDAAVTGADYLSGSVPAFAALMNQKAQLLGCDNTHFVTPNGLYAPDHYSCAVDLARIAAYALATQPVFDQIVDTQRYKIHRSVHIHDVWLKNTSTKFLKTFPGADGVKTGYIHQAGHCFVGSATRKGWRLIAVALDSNTCREDVESLLNYGYANFISTEVVPEGAAVGAVAISGAARSVPAQAGQEIRVVLPKLKPLSDFQITVTPLRPAPTLPIPVGEAVGTITVRSAGKKQASGVAVAARSVPAAAVGGLLPRGRHWGRDILIGLAALIGLVILLLAGGMIYGTAAKNARRRRRRLAAHMRTMDP